MAREWLRSHWQDEPIDVPVIVYLGFAVGYKKSHYRTGRNSHLLKDSAPAFPGQDVDNLIKGALDVMGGNVKVPGITLRNDSLVTDVVASKRYVDGPGSTIVRIEERADLSADPFNVFRELSIL